MSTSTPIPYDASPPRVPLWRRAAPWMIAFLVCCAWDRAVYLMATAPDGAPKLQWLEQLMRRDALWASLKSAAALHLSGASDLLLGLAYGGLYVFGRIWIWIALAMFFIFRHWGGTDGTKVGEGLRRGVFVALTPGLAGLAAELVKLLARRARPEIAQGMYTFLPWPDASPRPLSFLDTQGIGLASSHASTAVAGALAAGLLLPRWRIPLFLFALLCTASRVAVAAHFLSDAFAGAAIGCAVFALVYAWDRANNRGRAIAPTFFPVSPAAAARA